ncbi:Homogentisate phytyltransferase [Thalictrum thalictroides]|uniref:Homogentisate phytyltransferase n=1 Tax=Thalictrum thalictroides TaxID=46969 RepID=A0A7J6VS58_THATH|nr:Homogentisate phytyltransferase [Thalictrum thalictroides]
MVSSLVQCSSVLHKYSLHEQGDLLRRIRPIEVTRKGDEQGYVMEGSCRISFRERKNMMYSKVVGVTSNSLLAIEALSDFSPAFFLGLIMAWIPPILINTFSSGINQVYDVELDKVNKPFLPIASGEYSMKTGITVTTISGLLVPYLRGKRSSLFTALSIMYMRGIVVPFAFFAHTRKYILGRSLVYTRPVFFAASFVCTMAMTIALLKDLPDVEGDQVHGLNTLTVFLFCNIAIMMAYGGAVIVGLTSPFMFSKIITVFGHSAMAAILMFKARSVNLSDNKSTLDFYLFIWKLLYAEYFLIPFVR